MMVWVDTNVLLRFLIGTPVDQANKARRLLRRAADGEFALHVSNVVIAELIWVLGSVYRAEKPTIGDSVRAVVLADGITVDDEEVVLDALRAMVEANVDYLDAFVAASARVRGESVATFDSDFKRLGVEIVG